MIYFFAETLFEREIGQELKNPSKYNYFATSFNFSHTLTIAQVSSSQ